MLPELWRRRASAAHDWWGRWQWQHTEGCLALGSPLREVEGGEGGVGVYGTNYDISTLLSQPHSQVILTASFDCLE